MSACRNGSIAVTQIPSESTIKGTFASTMVPPQVTARVQQESLQRCFAVFVQGISTLVSWSSSRMNHRLLPLQRWAVTATQRMMNVLGTRLSLIPIELLELINIDLANVLRQCLQCLFGPRSESTVILNAADVLCSLTADLLHSSFRPNGLILSETMQSSICWSLHAIISIGIQNALVWRAFHQHLDSLILECIGDSNKLATHSRDFQVYPLIKLFAITHTLISELLC